MSVEGTSVKQAGGCDEEKAGRWAGCAEDLKCPRGPVREWPTPATRLGTMLRSQIKAPMPPNVLGTMISIRQRNHARVL